MLDLDPNQLAIVQEILAKYLPNKEVWAFGSRVKGTAKPLSDLDLSIFSYSKIDNILLIDI
jgi:predicted nucleotidyltransferase